MQLIQCIATHGSLYNNLILNFKDDVNILYGESGSGKTILIEAIIETVFDLLSPDFFKNNQVQQIHLNITFKYNNTDYRIIRDKGGIELHNFTTSKTVTCSKDESHEERRETIFNYDTDLFHFLSKVTADTVKNTSFITSPVSGKVAVPDYKTVLPLLFSDNSNFYQQCAFLSEYMKTDDNPLINDYNRIKRELKEVDHEIEIRNLRISKFTKIKEEHTQLFDEHKALEHEIESITSRLDLLKTLKQKQCDYSKMVAEKEALEKDYLTEKELEESIGKMVALIRRQYPLFLALDDQQKKFLPEIRTTFTTIQDIINSINKKNETGEQVRQKYKKTTITLSAVPLIISIIFYTQRDLFFLGIPGFQLALYFFIAAITSACWGLLALFFRMKRYCTEELYEQKTHHDLQLKTLLNKTNINIGESNSTELYELILQFFQEYSSFEEMRSEISDMKKSAKADYNDFYSKKIKLASHCIKEIERSFRSDCETAGIKYSSLSDFSYDAIAADFQRQIDTIKEKSTHFSDLLSQINSELDQFNNEKADNSDVSNRRETISDKLEKHQKKINSCTFITETFETVIQEKERLVFDEYSRTAYAHFLSLCGSAEVLSEEDFKSMLHKESTITLSPVHAHFFNVSLIISLNDFMTLKKPIIPLFADEPAMFMDKKRIDLLLPALKKISQKRQVILITHDSNTYESFGHGITFS
jgi:ABC-type dipeptide/oligopeptide/nickel transport system ATPase component